ncbi:ABC-three component system protein [Burkholderia sp. BCC1993]|uniref:ABC-three component system protein n=1 Tax=Burkholderia sp. BCC1993 TaxID=2817444 RepID=UPI002AB164D0|nr:ABC-three component system protein [Burkholderia sp. BCC1993]
MSIEEKVAEKKQVSVRTSVPGQAYGFFVQEVRVLWHLLRAQAGDVVALEHLGDVSVQTTDGVLSEEAKSGLSHNPIADRAVGLWKTLANWADARADGILPAGSIYVLYVVQQHRGAIADRLHRCANAADAVQLVADLRKHFAADLVKGDAKKAAKGGGKKSEKVAAAKVTKSAGASSSEASEGGDQESAAAVVKQLNRLFARTDEFIASIVVDFSLDIGIASPIEEVKVEISRSVPDEHLDTVTESLLGWVKARVMKQIEDRGVVGISYNEFREYRLAVQERTLGTLKAFPEHTSIPSRTEVDDHLASRMYVRQLDLLQMKQEHIERCVSDYLRASAARTEWADRGHLNAENLSTYIDVLVEHWNDSSMEVEMREAEKTPIERGVSLLFHCLKKDTAIRAVPVPGYFSRGSFHAIADETKIGWHPDWRTLLPNRTK